jgi:actin-like ATPase involved in cell morphogenesis
MFVGGGSQISGLYEYAKKKLDMPIIVSENPMDSVVCGAGKLLGVKDFAKIEL